MSNHLAGQTSPYLLQHQDNPVDWYPWGAEALALAREQDKPILLSIGYSACHWCHVMAHECFEDATIAALMNAHYVNIKVDREERPDIDQIYQLAHQLLTQRGGGWPLNMFLTPDQVPFFGGTYFPKTPRHGLPAFSEILQRVAEFYRDKKSELSSQRHAFEESFARTLPMSDRDSELSDTLLREARNHLEQRFDKRFGGFSDAPKFPHPDTLEFCLRYGASRQDEGATKMALFTLERMMHGGIYDQLGGGFCRYSVDAFWTIPHFEKMLYDNGPLLALVADAYAVSRHSDFKRVATQTADWVIREMQSPLGGYYSTIDADSEHEEGKFYVWAQDEIKGLLSDTEFAVAESYYGLQQPANFENQYWHLTVQREIELVARELNIERSEARALLDTANRKLFEYRETRVRPGRDEKILTSWNALMIKGMARAARIFGEHAWRRSARAAADFVMTTLWRDERLLATYKDGVAHLNAYLDDYAFMIDALLELVTAEFDVRYLEFAKTLADGLLDRFEDGDQGGFFFTSHDHESLLHRPKPGFDNATPSGNGIAAIALNRLAMLTGELRYRDAAERTLRAFYGAMQDRPDAFCSLLIALDEQIHPPQLAIVRGDEEQAGPWHTAISAIYMPRTMAIFVPESETVLPDALAKPAQADVNGWVCQGVTCLPPVNSAEALVEICKRGELV